jgi:hypothetical protein
MTASNLIVLGRRPLRLGYSLPATSDVEAMLVAARPGRPFGGTLPDANLGTISLVFHLAGGV